MYGRCESSSEGNVTVTYGSQKLVNLTGLKRWRRAMRHQLLDKQRTDRRRDRAMIAELPSTKYHILGLQRGSDAESNSL